MALVRLRNPLAFPGGQPGFNPLHPAAGPKMRFAAVPVIGGVTPGSTVPSMVSTYKPITFSVSGVGAHVQPFMTNVGPMIFINDNTSLIEAFANLPLETPSAVTIACIYADFSEPSNGVIFDNNFGINTTGSYRLHIESRVPFLVSNGLSISSGLTITSAASVGSVFHPFFIAVSYNGSVANFAITDMTTGKVQTSSASSSFTFGATGISSVAIGNYGGNGLNMAGYVGPVMYSVNNYLKTTALIAWAQAPWDFWYPPTVAQTIFASLRGSAANSATLAYTEAADTVAITATDNLTAALAYTEAPDAVAIAIGLGGDHLQIAYTEDADAFAINVQPVTPVGVVLDYTEPPDSFAIYGPMAAPPVRERTYTRRPLGWSFEPEIQIVKDRPGPLRIIEFSGWMS